MSNTNEVFEIEESGEKVEEEQDKEQTSDGEESDDGTDKSAADTDEATSTDTESTDEDTSEDAESEEDKEADDSTSDDEVVKDETEADPRDAVIGEFRRDLREANQRIADLQRETRTQAPPEKSPYEKEAEEQGIEVDELVPSVKLIREQTTFEQKQQDQVTFKERQAKLDQVVEEARDTMSEANKGKGLSLEQVVDGMGLGLMTQGDKRYCQDLLANGEDGMAWLYNRALERVEKAGGAKADRLKQLQSQAETTTKTAARTSQKPQAGTKEKKPQPKVDSQEDILAAARKRDPHVADTFGI